MLFVYWLYKKLKDYKLINYYWEQHGAFQHRSISAGLLVFIQKKIFISITSDTTLILILSCLYYIFNNNFNLLIYYSKLIWIIKELRFWLKLARLMRIMHAYRFFKVSAYFSIKPPTIIAQYSFLKTLSAYQNQLNLLHLILLKVKLPNWKLMYLIQSKHSLDQFWAEDNQLYFFNEIIII